MNAHDATDATPSSTRGTPRDPHRDDPLLWLQMSFSTAGYGALRAYRQKLALDTCRNIPLGVALDALIKSHPFCQDKRSPR